MHRLLNVRSLVEGGVGDGVGGWGGGGFIQPCMVNGSSGDVGMCCERGGVIIGINGWTGGGTGGWVFCRLLAT